MIYFLTLYLELLDSKSNRFKREIKGENSHICELEMIEDLIEILDFYDNILI